MPFFRRWHLWLRQQIAGEPAQGLLKRGSALLLMQIAGFAVQFFTGILLGRLLGASDYGSYSFAITLIILLRLGVAMGVPMMLLKSVAAYQGTGDWGRLKGLLGAAGITLMTTGGIMAMVVAFTTNFVWTGDDARVRVLLTIALPLLLIFPISEAAVAGLKGLHRVALAQVPEIVRMVLFLGVILLAIPTIGTGLDARSAMILRVIAEGVAFAVTAFILLRVLPAEVRQAKAIYDISAWRRGLISFAAIEATYVVFQQINILLLGTMRPMDEVGVFRMAANIVLVVQFVSLMAGLVLTPTIASAWAQGRRDFLQDICLRISRVGFILTLLAYGGLMLISPLIIAVLGHDFAALALPLAILGAGHLIGGLMPASSAVILMTGGERDAAWGIAAAALLNTLLNLALIPIAGIIGAASATAISTIALAVFYAVRGYQRTGIDSTVFRRLHLLARQARESR